MAPKIGKPNNTRIFGRLLLSVQRVNSVCRFADTSTVMVELGKGRLSDKAVALMWPKRRGWHGHMMRRSLVVGWMRLQKEARERCTCEWVEDHRHDGSGCSVLRVDPACTIHGARC